MRLMDDLHWLAGRWVEEQERAKLRGTLTTLGFRCVRDSKLFARLGDKRPIAVPIYEKVIAYLADPASWPGGATHGLPGDVATRLALLGCKVDGVRLVVEREVVERQLVLQR